MAKVRVSDVMGVTPPFRTVSHHIQRGKYVRTSRPSGSAGRFFAAALISLGLIAVGCTNKKDEGGTSGSNTTVEIGRAHV